MPRMRPMNGIERMLKSIEVAKARRAKALALYEERDDDGHRKRTVEKVAKILGCNKQRASELIKRARIEAKA